MADFSPSDEAVLRSLTSSDATVLTSVVQARKLPIQERLEFLEKNASEKGQRIGHYLLDPENAPHLDEDERKIADDIRRWTDPVLVG